MCGHASTKSDTSGATACKVTINSTAAQRAIGPQLGSLEGVATCMHSPLLNTGLLEGRAAVEFANQVAKQLPLRNQQGALLPNFAAELLKVAAKKAALLSKSQQHRRQGAQGWQQSSQCSAQASPGDEELTFCVRWLSSA